jgi:hypothetical protein
MYPMDTAMLEYINFLLMVSCCCPGVNQVVLQVSLGFLISSGWINKTECRSPIEKIAGFKSLMRRVNSLASGLTVFAQLTYLLTMKVLYMSPSCASGLAYLPMMVSFCHAGRMGTGKTYTKLSLFLVTP